MQSDYRDLFLKKYSKWRSAAERIEDPEFKIPLQPASKFGISFLDRSLGGIYNGDVILIGAKAGVGKTEIVSQISENLSAMGKRVNLIALEAGPMEIEKRIFFRSYAKKLFDNDKVRQVGAINFRRFCEGKLYDSELYEETKREVKEKTKTLNITYKNQTNYNIEDLRSQLTAGGALMDAIVLDHVHFIDLQDDNENREMKKIISEIRACSLEHNIPIIVVAHLRKNIARSLLLVPDIEDFHGSSDLIKIATTVILIAPRNDIDRECSYLYPTFFHVAKNRLDGSITKYVASINFDIRSNSYEKEFYIGTVSRNVWNPIEREIDMPWWVHYED